MPNWPPPNPEIQHLLHKLSNGSVGHLLGPLWQAFDPIKTDDKKPKACSGIPTRNDIVTKFDNGMTAVLQQSLFDKQSIHFMPTDISDEAEYIKGSVKRFISRIESNHAHEDELEQKSAERWIKEYIKDLCNALKKDEAIISHLWKDAIIHAEGIYSSIGRRDRNIDYTTNNDYLNALDKITDSTQSKLSIYF
ncbi:14747_t:CDS:2 [Cetraspora pellucida]|uniref:14747_t:CDS:1 n=1 Tax=Cetraspora pellucida TaxID=1433469 RepID=A0A9N8YXM1_9GLOM|nr:14747_t:CDS:2 [Cetraspora pellucida]